MKITIDPQKERVLKKLLSAEQIESRIQSIVNQWVDDAIKNNFFGSKKLNDILNELDT